MEAHIGNVTCWKKHMVQLTNRINSKWAGLEKTSHSSYMVCLWQAVTVKLQVSPWFVLNNCYRVRCLKQPGSNKLNVWNNVQIMNKKLLWLWEKHDNHLSQTVAMINRLLRYLGPWHEGATEGILQRDKIGGANWRHPAKETRLKEPTEGILQDNH